MADLLGVERTCEALVVDRRGILRYRGAIDDQYERGARRAEPTRRYLVEAIEAVLAGRSVATPTTEVIGCPIARADPEPSSRRPRVRPASAEMLDAFRQADPPVSVGRVTYTEGVASILEAKCRSCHRPGQVGPFALMTYAQARKWAGAIREVVEERRMPPWHADPRYGHFANDRRLSAREYATLLAWVDAGMPEVNPARSRPRRSSRSTGRSAGRTWSYPCLRRSKCPTGALSPTSASGCRPGSPGTAGSGRRRRSPGTVRSCTTSGCSSSTRGRGPSATSWPSTTPATRRTVYPPGVARLIPGGSDLLIEVHYTPIGKPRSDRSRVGLVFFAEGSPRFRVRTQSVANKALLIPPGEANFRHESTFTLPNDARLLSVMPHMHLRGKSFRCSVAYPDGRRDLFLSIPAYDFGWQGLYRLAEPLALPRGSRIDCVAHFDNSADNPANPDPTKLVGWGEQSWDEMMVAYVDYCEPVPSRAGPRDVTRAASPGNCAARLIGTDAGSRNSLRSALCRLP